jgi:hypothetical protein
MHRITVIEDFINEKDALSLIMEMKPLDQKSQGSF